MKSSSSLRLGRPADIGFRLDEVTLDLLMDLRNRGRTL